MKRLLLFTPMKPLLLFAVALLAPDLRLVATEGYAIQTILTGSSPTSSRNAKWKPA